MIINNDSNLIITLSNAKEDGRVIYIYLSYILNKDKIRDILAQKSG